MRGPVLLLSGALAVFALLALAGWARHRALVRGPGRFAGVLVTDGGRRRRVVGCFRSNELVLSHHLLPERRLWAAERWRLEVDRLPAAEAGRTRLRITDASGRSDDAVDLEVEDDVAGAVRAWTEAGPSQAGQSWWRPPGAA